MYWVIDDKEKNSAEAIVIGSFLTLKTNRILEYRTHQLEDGHFSYNDVHRDYVLHIYKEKLLISCKWKRIE